MHQCRSYHPHNIIGIWKCYIIVCKITKPSEQYTQNYRRYHENWRHGGQAPGICASISIRFIQTYSYFVQHSRDVAYYNGQQPSWQLFSSSNNSMFLQNYKVHDYDKFYFGLCASSLCNKPQRLVNWFHFRLQVTG